MNPLRRLLLKGAGASTTLLAAIAAGALKPGEVLAADWKAAAFEANNIAAALAAMGIVDPVESSEVTLRAPDIAEDGAVVSIEVSSKLANTQKLSVFIDKNPTPLAALFDLAGGASPSLALRVKMQQTSRIRVVAHVGDKFYFTTKEVQVTIGGCGG